MLFRSGEGGQPWGYYHLGRALLEGDGVERDVDAARHWLRSAAAGGVERARALLDG